MLVFTTKGIKGFFNPKSGTAPVGQITSGGKVSTVQKGDTSLINLPTTDIAIPFGFSPNGTATSIHLKNAQGVKENIFIQWGVNDTPLAVIHSVGEGGRVVMKDPMEIEAFAEELGFDTQNVSRSVASKVASAFLKKLSEKEIAAIESNFPGATWYQEKNDDFRTQLERDKTSFHIEVCRESQEPINSTINALISILSNHQEVLAKILSEIKTMQEKDKESLSNDYDLFIDQIIEGEIKIDTKDFGVDFSPSTFAALENLPEEPSNSYERFQESIADKLPHLASAELKTATSGVLGAYSVAMGNFLLDHQMYRETQSYDASREESKNPDSIISIDKRLTSLFFEHKKAQTIISTVDKNKAIEDIEERMLKERKTLSTQLGEEIVKPLTLDAMTRKGGAGEYHRAISDIAYAYQKNNKLDLNSMIRKSSFNKNALFAFGGGSHIPYNAAKSLESNPHNTAMMAVQRSTLSSHTLDNGKRVLIEGQTMSPTKIISPKFIAGIPLTQTFHERMATAMQKLSTLTAKGYKHATINDEGKAELVIMTDTNKQVEVLISILEAELRNNEITLGAAANRMFHAKEIKKSQITKTFEELKKEDPLHKGMKALQDALKEASLSEGEQLNKKVKDLVKKPHADYAPIINAALHTNISALYEANRELRFIRSNQKEMNGMAKEIFAKLRSGSITKDTEALSIAASGDEKRDYTNAKTAVGIYKKTISAFHIHARTEKLLAAQGEAVLGIAKKDKTPQALMYKSPEGSILSSAISTIKAATRSANEKYQSFFIPTHQTNTTASVRKEIEKEFSVKGKTQLKKIVYTTIQLKNTRSLNVILGKMKALSAEMLASIEPTLNEITSKKLKNSAVAISGAISQYMTEGKNVSSDVIEKAAQDIPNIKSDASVQAVQEEIAESITQEDAGKSEEAIEAEALMEAQKVIDNAQAELEMLEESALGLENFNGIEGDEVAPSLEDEIAAFEMIINEDELFSIEPDSCFEIPEMDNEDTMHVPNMTP